MAHVGQEFTHQRFLQPGWQPGPGEKHKDAPKARMVVTSVKMRAVFYTYVDPTSKQRGRGAFYMDADEFNRTYPEEA